MNSRIDENTRPANILVVDDEVKNLQLLSDLLSKSGYKVRPAINGKVALRAVAAEPPDVILLDILMPDMDGFEVCRAIREIESCKQVPIIFVSALNSVQDKIKAFSFGGVDYISKPFRIEELIARVEIHLKIARQIELERKNNSLQNILQEQLCEIADSRMATIVALAKLAESRDDVTGKHLERVQKYCEYLAICLKKHGKFQSSIDDSYIETICNACTLHDIGKVAICDNVLLKKGKLTEDEFENIKRHTIIGAETLETVRNQYPGNLFINMGIAIARHHHERWDGKGYPNGLFGEDIPLSARIMSVVDVYDALTTERPYKKRLSHSESTSIIVEGKGAMFDPEIIEVFRNKEVNEEFNNIREMIK